MKLEPSRRKGIFVGYSESSKAFRVYIPGFKQIETSRDVTFDEDATFNRSRRNRAEKVLDEEPKVPRVTVRDDEERDLVDHDMVEPQMSVNPPKEVSHKRKPAWAYELIHDAERYGALEGSLRESKIPRIYSSYMALLSDIIDVEPSSFEEVVGKQVWKDSMQEEYQSIMKNDILDVVPRPERKFVVTSKWIYKIKHAMDGSIEKYKAPFMAWDFLIKKGLIMRKHLPLW